VTPRIGGVSIEPTAFPFPILRIEVDVREAMRRWRVGDFSPLRPGRLDIRPHAPQGDEKRKSNT
jgi:hypothetical protein